MPKIEVIARGVARRESPDGPEILLCRAIAGGYTYLPGGHVEFGELADDALRREMIEESGLSVEVGPLLLTCEATFIQAGKQRHEINLVFHMKHPSVWPEQVPTLEDEISFEWRRQDQLRSGSFRPVELGELLEGGLDDLPGLLSVQ